MAKSDTLFVTDDECAARLGLTMQQFRTAVYRSKGFPAPDPFFANRRYWPAVCAWLDRRHGLGSRRNRKNVPPTLDGEDSWEWLER
ncbi:winged helix-turn-helix domain-containing protein [Rhizobiaceae bacterium n13]|uniref:Winged helix-turn-helix domain-containing protein n=1 Tax=Ferirhizobium litorale TaxID=2927786 RepID=A0AAE3U1T7_9HYPH|nr:winged helix-turn-helix domain-containing protein [Fererhizobium litorale]MDI7922826.1 winged helix-turn-helix domain-containing protein [Fererhizobium litorale]